MGEIGHQANTAGALSRGDLLLKGALALGSAYGAAAVGPYVRSALAGSSGSDVEVLNFLLGFEYMQVSLYNRVKAEVNDKGEKMKLGSAEKALIDLLFQQEAEHVSAVKKLIEKMGGKPVAKGSYAFAFRIFEQVLSVAASIESAAVGAWNGAIPRLTSDEARELAYEIVQVDARHAAMVRIGLHEPPAPETFDRRVSENSSITSVVPFTGVYPEEE